jgi:hypothetical protein
MSFDALSERTPHDRHMVGPMSYTIPHREGYLLLLSPVLVASSTEVDVTH